MFNLIGPRNLRIESVRLDGRLLEGQLSCETIASAISVGTELAAWRGDPPLRPGKAYPRLMGYCNVARVLAVGPGVTVAAPGTAILTFQSHRSAFVCAESEVVATLPSGGNLEALSLTYLFQLGLGALQRCEAARESRVAVIGLGLIGLATVAVWADAGGIIDGFSRRAWARAAALEFGARQAYDTTEATSSATVAGGYDVVISTSNTWDDWRVAMGIAGRFAKIGVLGFPGRNSPPPSFNPLASQHIYDKQLAILGCGQTPDDEIKQNCRHLAARIAVGALPAERLIGPVVPWQELGALYETLEARNDSRTGVLRWT